MTLRGQNCASHTIIPPPAGEPLIRGRMDQCCSHEVLILPLERCSFLFLQEWHLVWSSAAIAHLLQGLMCCVLGDVLPNNLVVISSFLSYFCLLINLKQSGLSLQTSGISLALLHRELLLIGCLLFFRSFFRNPRDGCAGKLQKIAVSEILSALGISNNATKSFKSPFFLRSDV